MQAVLSLSSLMVLLPPFGKRFLRTHKGWAVMVRATMAWAGGDGAKRRWREAAMA